MNELPTQYQQFIHLSRYAKFNEELGRRELWPETIERWKTFWINRHPEYEQTFEHLANEIQNLKVMPSMRTLMTAGKALERDEVANFNCSFLAVDSPRAFDESVYILMTGCGLGFSVEEQYINKLPEVAEDFHDTDTIICVNDSRIGWAKAVKEMVSLLYSGLIPQWDLSKIRPAGAPLKTFGGRASGSGPLNDLFEFLIHTFKNASGRKLNSMECHDIMCFIGDIVIAGGVRRSALISLSSLYDDRMRNAKNGQWWMTDPQRALANNSAVYEEKPSFEVFLNEWQSLYESKCGERGIFSRYAAQKKASENGRRDSEKVVGTNPCCFSGGMRLLTDRGYVSFYDLSQRDSVNIVNHNGNITEGKVWSSGVKDIITLVIRYNDGTRYINCTPDHIFMDSDGNEVEAQNLKGKYIKGYNLSNAFVEEINTNMGKVEVFDFTEPETHWGVVEGCVVHNSEILLRANQFCNLSTIIIDHNDTLEDIKNKIEQATIVGTFQSTLTNFRYLRKIWKNNTEEERLLGVSMTGIMDHPVLSKTNNKSKEWLQEMREHAVQVNEKWSAELGINQSTAITCTKPEGNTSQLTNTSSGVHPRYSQYYLRTVRADQKDPLSHFMIDKGFYYEVDAMKPETGYVFYFPVKAPSTSITVDQVSAIDQLKLWENINENYCEHKPSVTVYYTDDDFLEVGNYVWNNFDKISGVSFLPYDGGTYKQAPYQPIDKKQYDEWVKAMPKDIDWSELEQYEAHLGDQTTAQQELACSGGACEL